MKEYLPIPFKDKGRDRNGVDCWGLVRLIYRDKLNIELPSYVDDYIDTEDLSLGKLIDEESKKWVEVEVPEPLDVIVLRMRNRPMHVGVVIDDESMLHCEYGIGVCLENFKSFKWEKRVIGFFRHIEKKR